MPLHYGSDIAQNHSMSKMVINIKSHMKSWPRVKLDQVGVGSNTTEFTRLSSSNSYLVIIFPN